MRTREIPPLRNDLDSKVGLEIRALVKMVRALCRHTEQLVSAARSRGALDSREAELQLRAFAERRSEALKLPAATEPPAMRIARLEKLVEMLECSRAYFRELERDGDGSERSLPAGEPARRGPRLRWPGSRGTRRRG